MQRLHRDLRAKVAAAWTQIKVIQMPDHRGPGVVQHPLNHARGTVLIPTVSLVHRAHTLIGLKLRFERIILDAARLPEARVQRISKNVNVLECATAGMVVPPVVDRPQVLLRQHLPDALNWRHRRAHAGFGIKAKRAAAPSGVALVR